MGINPAVGRRADEFLKFRRSSIFHSHSFLQFPQSFMKTLILGLALCCVTVVSAQTPSLDANAGATTVATNPVIQTIVGYQTGEQTANQNVWQKIIQITDAQGNATYQTNNAYTELATGLNHLVNGQWTASKEEVDISADGNSALATNGQHQAHFPGDIYNGQIELVTPDGKQLFSRPVGLSYFDGTKSVLIAELTNSTGQVMDNNQVMYANAFTDFKADVLYTYTKAGFEQDIILREQPPSPASFGLNPDTTRLQVLTEFFNPPQPTVSATTVPTDVGDLENDNLDFGVMQMIPGRAFLLGITTPSVAVNKQWLLLNGRQLLVEEVPVVSIVAELENLPLPQTTSTQPNPPLNIVSTKRLLPTQRMAIVPNKHPMQMVQATPSSRGLVLDYVTMTSQSNFTFQGDTTYYISGGVTLYQTNTFEGGAVLKYTNNASVTLANGSVLNWKAAAYRPVIFTAMDDNSVGDAISGSTGSPTNYYANPALSFNGTNSLSYFRIAWASQAVSANYYGPVTLYHGQMVNCLNGISCLYGNLFLRNLLFANVQTNFNNISTSVINLQNTTFSGSACLVQGPAEYTSPTLTNCILANVTNLTAGTVSALSGTTNGFYNCPEFGTGAITNTFYPFQTVGEGSYYLTNGCNFINAGTTNIDSTLLSNLWQKTTYPPIVLTNNFTGSTTLNPQAQRDTDIPDLGYHYDPLDYCWSGLSGTLLLTNGVAIGVYGASGFSGTLTSQGTPLEHNQVVRYSTVQEQSIVWGTNMSGSLLGNGTVSLRFTDVSFLAGAYTGRILFDTITTNAVLQDCQLWTVYLDLVGTGASGITFKNNVFQRCSIYIGEPIGFYFNAYLYNNLFNQGSFQLYYASLSYAWYIADNLFDQSSNTYSFIVVPSLLNNGYYQATSFGGINNKTLTNVDFQTGPLGAYYYPTNGGNLSLLLNAGSTKASALGLYHYTVTTNEVVEGTNTVSIGYHYVATDANGIPISTPQDGIPDYLADANGNGLVDAGEISWTNYDSINGLTGGNGVLVFTPLK
jgi:hypothetical protein